MTTRDVATYIWKLAKEAEYREETDLREYFRKCVKKQAYGVEQQIVAKVKAAMDMGKGSCKYALPLASAKRNAALAFLKKRGLKYKTNPYSGGNIEIDWRHWHKEEQEREKKRRKKE